MSETSFTYLGLKLSSFELGITVDQTQYVDSIEHIPKEMKRSQNSKLTDKEITKVRGKVGQLNWLATHTRPDIAFEVSDLGSNIANPTYRHIIIINKVIDIRGNSLSILRKILFLKFFLTFQLFESNDSDCFKLFVWYILVIS